MRVQKHNAQQVLGAHSEGGHSIIFFGMPEAIYRILRLLHSNPAGFVFQSDSSSQIMVLGKLLNGRSFTFWQRTTG
jgi:hypothetical protein